MAEFRERKDQMISDFHHRGLVPQICSIAGLVNLAQRPHHHEYAKLAYKHLMELLKYLRDNIVKIEEDQNKLNDAIDKLKEEL